MEQSTQTDSKLTERKIVTKLQEKNNLLVKKIRELKLELETKEQINAVNQLQAKNYEEQEKASEKLIEKLEKVARDVNQRNDDLKKDYEYLRQSYQLLEEVKSEEFTMPDANMCSIDCSKVDFQQSEIDNDSAKITVLYPTKRSDHIKCVFNIVQFIDKGAFGRVYKTTVNADGDDIGKNSYAIKIIDKHQADSMENATKIECERRWQAEMMIQSRLNHPNIVKLYNCYQNKHLLLLQMTFCKTSLLHYTKSQNIMSEGKINGLARDLFKAVNYLHSKNILHRDIKPANVLLKTDRNMTWALGDFGLAIDLNDESNDNSWTVGTKEYLPPEVQPSAAADVWSSAIVIFEVLTGKRPEPLVLNYTKSTHSQIDLMAYILRECFHETPSNRPSAAKVLENLNCFIHSNDSDTSSI